ncbi:pentapeptide repeat-containing protein, partial [Lactococcus lactis]|uniref:pentapeptide repeat-containing protein n=1 Tax=Lactococcus lactis TaxID=1358 RepID=UPI00071D901C
MKKIKFIKINYEKKTQDKLISSTLNGYLLLIIILCSIVLSILIYKSNDWLSLKLDNTMTGYIAIVGSLPTVYLWVVRERKKEEDLKNKQQEINQIKVSELNKVYVDAVNQFYNEKTFIAGAYALLALIDDWINMSKDYKEKAKDYYPKVSQISSIIFSEQNNNLNNVLYHNIIIELFKKITKLDQEDAGFYYDWSRVSLKEISLTLHDLRNTNLAGIELIYSSIIFSELNNTNISFATLTKIELTESNLSGANLICSDLSEAKLNSSNLKKADLSYANFSFANLTGANLTNADLTSADL